MRRAVVFSAVAALLSSSAISTSAQERSLARKGRVVIPDSSIERTDEIGYRMHTNTRIFVPADRAKFGAEPNGLALPDVAGLPPAGPLSPAPPSKHQLRLPVSMLWSRR